MHTLFIVTLNHCIFEEEYFTAETLEQLIASYELGFMETANQPTLIDSKTLRRKDNSLKQNGNILSLFWKILVCVFSIVFLFFIFFCFFLFFFEGGGGDRGFVVRIINFFPHSIPDVASW